jgi:hypothetical protein
MTLLRRQYREEGAWGEDSCWQVGAHSFGEEGQVPIAKRIEDLDKRTSSERSIAGEKPYRY